MALISSAELGMDTATGPVKGRSSAKFPAHRATRKDYFVQRNGVDYAGAHLIVDLHHAHRLDDLEHIEKTLKTAVDASGATLLHIHLHHFTPNNGVSGVAVLAESHISIHTWPERGFAALDVFMCGDTHPERTLRVFELAFSPASLKVTEHLRGRSDDSSGSR